MSADDRVPSQVTDDYWLVAFREEGEDGPADYPLMTERSGKWLVFAPWAQLDDLWPVVREATREGQLGSASKVSTRRPNPNAVDPAKGVICVYTYDHEDEADVRRVRDVLRELGVTWKLPYKADADTRAGRYAHRGDRVSLYYE